MTYHKPTRDNFAPYLQHLIHYSKYESDNLYRVTSNQKGLCFPHTCDPDRPVKHDLQSPDLSSDRQVMDQVNLFLKC